MATPPGYTQFEQGNTDDLEKKKMTRLSVQLRKDYPRRLIWWMECDRCQVTRSRPAWSADDLPLDEFRLAGWRCEYADTCPACLALET